MPARPASEIPAADGSARTGFIEMFAELDKRAAAAHAAHEARDALTLAMLARVHHLLVHPTFLQPGENDVYDPKTQIKDAPDDVFLTLTEWAKAAPHAWQRAGYTLALLRTESIWNARGLPIPKRYLLVRQLVDAEIEAAANTLTANVEPKTKGLDYVTSWRRIMEFAPSFGFVTRLEGEREALLKAAEVFFTEAPWWSVDILATVIAVANEKKATPLPTAEVERIGTLVDRAEDRLRETKSFQSPEDIIELRTQLARLRGGTRDSRDIACQRGENLVAEAESHPTRWLRARLLNDASREFEQAGNRERAEQLKLRAIEEKRLSDELGEMKTVSSPLDINEQELDEYIEGTFQGAQTMVDRLDGVASRYFVGPLDDPRRPLPTLSSPFAELMTRVTFIDDRVKDTTVPDTPERENQNMQRALMFALQLGNIVVERAWEHFIAPLVGSPDDLVAHLIPDFEAANRTIWERLARAAFEKDWIAVLHIGAPRAERVVRETLRLLGEPTTSRDRIGGGLLEKSFGDLVRVAEDNGRLPPMLARYIRCTLTEEWGLNLRNRVAHGLLAEHECTSMNALRLLHLLLVVRRWSARARQTPSAAA